MVSASVSDVDADIRRKRRVFGPVKGNNTTGRAGKLKCQECRKIRSKVLATLKVWANCAQCIYQSETDPCDFCSERDLPCRKVWGPLRNADSHNSRQFPRCYAESLTTYSVSIIANSNLSSKDLFYARKIQFIYDGDIGPKPIYILGTLLRYIWHTHGYDFSNAACPLLHSSAMAFAAIHQGKFLTKLTKPPSEYFEYLSDVHKHLLQVLKTNLVVETHLFAVFILVETSYRYSLFDPAGKDAVWTYTKIFCSMLQCLIRQYPYPHRKPLWRFVLTCFRRNAAFGIFPISEASDMLFHQLDLLDAEFPPNYNYLDLWTRCVGDCTFQLDDSLIHSWNVDDMVLSLRTGFRRAYLPQVNPSSTLDSETIIDRELNFIQLLYDVRHRANAFERYRYIDSLFAV